MKKQNATAKHQSAPTSEDGLYWNQDAIKGGQKKKKKKFMKRKKDSWKEENSENTYNVEIHNFCYIPKKLMYFSFS